MPPSSRHEPIEVLLLEDDALLNLATAEMLDQLGFRVTACMEVEEALAAIAGKRPQIGVLDVNIRGTQRYEVAEQLRDLDIPIIFLTGETVASLAVVWQRTPVCQKPCVPEELKLRILRLVRPG